MTSSFDLAPGARRRSLLLVALLHLAALGLLLQTRPPLSERPAASAWLQLLWLPRAAPVQAKPATPATSAAQPQSLSSAARTGRLEQAAGPTQAGGAATAAPDPTVAPANASAGPALPGLSGLSAPSLDLRLPPATLRAPAAGSMEALRDRLSQDPRSNSPMDSGVERMARALGAQGWTVIDLGDGSKKVTGPFGECQIIRPSMVDGIPDHPHAGLLPPRSFGCGGIEKGSLEHRRPHERP